MAKNILKTYYQYDYAEKNIHAEMTIDLSRFEKQYSRAQYRLDSMVSLDMIPYMPMDTGQFINVTRAMSAATAGTGLVYAAAPPFGRYLYEGKVMVDAQTGKGPYKIPDNHGGYILRFRKGAKLIATDRKLKYSLSAHPNAQSRWFDTAKRKNLSRWAKEAKKIAGGGT